MYSRLGDVIILLGDVASLSGIPRENLMNEDRSRIAAKAFIFKDSGVITYSMTKLTLLLISWRGVLKINICSVTGVEAVWDTACVMIQWRRET
jgi:hypothetical protein